MFPFGAIGAWSKARRAEWQRSALHVVDTVATPVSAASFHMFQRNNFCSAPFRLSFSCWMSFTTRGPISNPTKTENEFPSEGKLEILGKTSHANNPTQRSQQEQKVFKVTLITLATSTGLNSGASVFSARLSSCSAPGATAAGTLDLGHPMHALPKRFVKSWKNIRIRDNNMKLLWKGSLKHVERSIRLKWGIGI